MDKIKLIHTGKTDILAVMVPDSYTSYCIETGCLFFGPIKDGIWDFDGKIELPQSNWQILGLSDQITDQEWDEVLDHAMGSYLDYVNNVYRFETPIDSGLSILEANGCYSVNPMEPVWEQTDANGTPYNKHFNYHSYLRAYNEAQENTGK